MIFASIVGGFSLGQAAPSLAVFNTGRVSGARIYKVINRKPQFDVDGKGEVPDKQLQVRASAADEFSVAVCSAAALRPRSSRCTAVVD